MSDISVNGVQYKHIRVKSNEQIMLDHPNLIQQIDTTVLSQHVSYLLLYDTSHPYSHEHKHVVKEKLNANTSLD